MTSPIGIQMNLTKVTRIAVFTVLRVNNTNGNCSDAQSYSDTLVKKVGELQHFTIRKIPSKQLAIETKLTGLPVTSLYVNEIPCST